MYSSQKTQIFLQKAETAGLGAKREFLLTGSLSVIQLERFLEMAVKPGIEKQPPTVNSHGKLKDRKTCII